MMVTFEDFQKLNIRVGKIIDAELLNDGKYSTHKLTIDFGKDIGVKKSCARLVNYTLEELKGRQVLGVVNFPSRQIGKNISETLILGVPDEKNECILIKPDKNVPIGAKLY